MSSNDHIRNGYNQSRYYKDDIGAAKRNRKFQSHHTHHNPHHNGYSNHSSYQQQQQPPTTQPYSHQSSVNPFSSRRQDSTPASKTPTTNNTTGTLPNNSSVPSSSSTSQSLPSQSDQFQQHYRTNDKTIPFRNGAPSALGAKQRRSNYRAIPRPGPPNPATGPGNISRNSSSSGLPSQSSYYRSYGPTTGNGQPRYPEYSDFPTEDPYVDPMQMQQMYGHAPPPPPRRLSSYSSKAERYGNTGGDLINSSSAANVPPQIINDKRYSNRKSYNDARFGPSSRQSSQGGNAYPNRGSFRDDYRGEEEYYRSGSAGQYADRHYQGYGGRYPVEFKRDYQTSQSSSLIHSVHPKPKPESLSPANETKKSSAASSMAPSIRNDDDDDDIEEDLFPEKAAFQRATPDISTSSTTPTNVTTNPITVVKKEESGSNEKKSVPAPNIVDKSESVGREDENEYVSEQIKLGHTDHGKSIKELHSDKEESQSTDVIMRDASPFIQANSSEESYSPIGNGVQSPEQLKKEVTVEEIKEKGEIKVPEIKEEIKSQDEKKSVGVVETVQNGQKLEKVDPVVDNVEVYSDDDSPVFDKYIFPLTNIESKYWKIKYCSKRERRKKLKYLSKTPLQDLKQYSFIDSTLLIFKQADGPNLMNKLTKIHDILELKKKYLTEEFVSRKSIWNDRVGLMDSQLKDFYKIDTQETSDNKSKQNHNDQDNNLGPPKTPSSRRNRHHGDSVRTEAEFLEILESLEREREKDPLVKAQYGAATIPDMIMNPVEKYSCYLDSNNLVLDKQNWATRIQTDQIDTFTEAEHEKFCEAFAMWPKKFGRISHFMGGLRTTEECVLHYYKTKKNTNFKNIVANRNKRTTRKAAAYKRKQKEQLHKSRNDAQTSESSATEQNTPLALTPMADSETDLPSDINLISANGTSSGNGQKRKKPSTSSTDPKKRKVSGSAISQDTNFNEISKQSQLSEQQQEQTTQPFEKQQQQQQQLDQQQHLHHEQQPQLQVLSEPLDVKPNANNPNISIPQIHGDDQSQLHPGFVFSNQGLKTIQQTHVDVPQVASSDQQQAQQPPPDKKKTRRGRKKQTNVVINPDGALKVESTEDKKLYKDRSHITSYWSVQESNMFPVLLEKFGTDWDSIAKSIGTKSATMVRNYYQRGSSENSNWESIACAADSRKTEDNIETESKKPSTLTHERQPSAPSVIYQQQQQQQQQQQPQQQPLSATPLVGGPPLGYFHNKSYSYSSPITNPHASLNQQQHPSQPPQLPPLYSLSHQSSVPIKALTSSTVDIRNDSIGSTTSQHQRHESLPGIPTLNSAASSFSNSPIYGVKPPLLPTPLTATHSTGMMKMSALLNSPVDPPNLSHPQTHLPPLTLGNNIDNQQDKIQAQTKQPTPISLTPASTPFIPKPRASIMSLLNSDENANSSRPAVSGYPPIVHNPTTATSSLPSPQQQHLQLQQQRVIYHASPLSQLMNPVPSLSQPQQQPVFFNQPQVQQQQEQQRQQPQGTQGQPSHLSALDALAQVAFERK